MGYITYKQADSRWGKKNYNGSSSMATAGCGPTSVAMLAYAVDGETTPWDVAKYMRKHGYAIRNNGTARSGIPAAMKAFGLQDVKEVVEMTDVWNYLSKGYCADFLFESGSRGGITWTSSGHYVAVTDYKVKNGKHYLYTRDSGGRNHTGWYCYETQMKGLIPKIWVGKVPNGKPAPKPTKPIAKPTVVPTLPSRGYFKNGDKGVGVTQLQKILLYLKISVGEAGVDSIYGQDTVNGVKAFQKKYKLQIDGEWGKQCNNKASELLGIKKKVPTPVKPTPKSYAGTFPNLSVLAPEFVYQTAIELAWPYGTKTSKYKYPNGSPTSAFKKAINKAYPNRSGWSDRPKRGASCDVFVGTVVRASGHDGSFPRGLSDVAGHVKKKPIIWKTINKPKKSELKAGDIVVWETSSAGHIFVYTGNNREAEANHNGKKFGHISKLYIPSKPKKYVVYRPIGGRRYLTQGDTCLQVVYLQRFLNWCLNINLKDDGGFGSKTADAVREYQKKYGLTPDGVFGEASLVKAKTIKK